MWSPGAGRTLQAGGTVWSPAGIPAGSSLSQGLCRPAPGRGRSSAWALWGSPAPAAAGTAAVPDPSRNLRSGRRWLNPDRRSPAAGASLPWPETYGIFPASPQPPVNLRWRWESAACLLCGLGPFCKASGLLPRWGFPSEKKRLQNSPLLWRQLFGRIRLGLGGRVKLSLKLRCRSRPLHSALCAPGFPSGGWRRQSKGFSILFRRKLFFAPSVFRRTDCPALPSHGYGYFFLIFWFPHGKDRRSGAPSYVLSAPPSPVPDGSNRLCPCPLHKSLDTAAAAGDGDLRYIQ